MWKHVIRSVQSHPDRGGRNNILVEWERVVDSVMVTADTAANLQVGHFNNDILGLARS